MRIDAQKILFIGPESKKKLFFETCQEFGVVHFIEPKGFIKPGSALEVERCTDALRILRSYKTCEVFQKDNGHDVDVIISDILHAKEEIFNLQNQKNSLLQELDYLQLYGAFSLEDTNELNLSLWNGKSSLRLAEKQPELYSFGTIEGIEYFATFAKDFKGSEGLTAIPIEKSTQDMLEEVQICQTSIEALEGRIKDALHHEKRLRNALVEASNKQHLNHAQLTAGRALDEMLFYAEGWVPLNKVAEVLARASKMNIWAELLEKEEHDIPPTVLQNKGTSRIGEDLVHIFDTPSSTDKDPSLWVLTFFSLFFAMIVGDGGYGLVFLAITFYIWKKYHPKEGLGRRFIKLVGILATTCILWGLCIHSFFGISLSPENPLRSHSPLTWLVEKKASYYLKTHDTWYQEAVRAHPALANATTPQQFLYSDYSMAPNGKEIYNLFADNVMFELALLIGSLHILFGFLRYGRKNPIGLGWALFLVGGYLYLPGYLKALSILTYAFGFSPEMMTYVGFHLLTLGPIISVSIALVKNGFTGIFEVMTGIQVFADVLSYLRIYALALAGAIVGNVINGSIDKLPLFVVPVVLIVAHLVNILLGIVGGVIHGLRLNFLEWYHYSFEGGGKEYRPLSRKEPD